MVIDNHGKRILAQSRPSGTSAASIYSPPDNFYALVYSIVIANVTGSAANASVFLDPDGTTYDQTTALLYAKSIPANDSEFIELTVGLEIDAAANIAVQTGTGDALTFTLMGRVFGTL